MVAACASLTSASAGAAFGGASLSCADDHDPRSKEQPQSAIAANTTGADARGPKREAPEKGWGTGMAIDAEHSRAYAVLVARCVAKCIGQNNDAGTKARVIGFKICKEIDQRDPRGPAPPRPPPGPPRSAPGPAPNTDFGFIGSRPSRCSFLRASLRARRTASAFSRAFFSEGFS